MGIGIRHMVLEPKVGKENRGDCLHKVRKGLMKNILRVARSRYFVVKRRLPIWRI